jgi:hypothetical protein
VRSSAGIRYGRALTVIGARRSWALWLERLERGTQGWAEAISRREPTGAQTVLQLEKALFVGDVEEFDDRYLIWHAE